jgi:hypothetical protein
MMWMSTIIRPVLIVYENENETGTFVFVFVKLAPYGEISYENKKGSLVMTRSLQN